MQAAFGGIPQDRPLEFVRTGSMGSELRHGDKPAFEYGQVFEVWQDPDYPGKYLYYANGCYAARIGEATYRGNLPFILAKLRAHAAEIRDAAGDNADAILASILDGTPFGPAPAVVEA